jgi:hypothetical protein
MKREGEGRKFEELFGHFAPSPVFRFDQRIFESFPVIERGKNKQINPFRISLPHLIWLKA